MPLPTLDDELLNALLAYGQVYGWPTSTAEQRGLTTTLLRLLLESKAEALGPQDMERLISRVVAKLSPTEIARTAVNQAQLALIDQAHRLKSELTQQINDTLVAYIQSGVGELAPQALSEAILAAVPLLVDYRITKEEVNGLMSHVVDSFDVEAALGAEINPAVVQIAKSLVKALGQKPLEEAVAETVTAYVEQFAPNLENIGEDLIERALGAVLKNQVDFGLDVDWRLLDRKLLIDQISFKLNLMEQSPLPSKTARQIAAELEAEIQKLKQEREAALGKVDVTGGLVGNDGLSISSGWTSTRQPKSSSIPSKDDPKDKGQPIADGPNPE